MKKKLALMVVTAIIAIVAGYSIWIYVDHLDYLGKTRHETDRWGVIMDLNEDIIAVETVNDEVWNALDGLY